MLTGADIELTTNGHDVTGGNGGESLGSGIPGSGGGGGVGLVLLDGGVMTVNGGTIGGGSGGTIGSFAGDGGAGLFLYRGGELTHLIGTVQGGNGGGMHTRRGRIGGTGGAAVLSNLGTLTNAATIFGGDGGYGWSWGGDGGAGLQAWAARLPMVRPEA